MARSETLAQIAHRLVKEYPFALELAPGELWPRPEKVKQKFGPDFAYIPIGERRFYLFETELHRSFFARTFKIPLTIPTSIPLPPL